MRADSEEARIVGSLPVPAVIEPLWLCHRA